MCQGLKCTLVNMNGSPGLCVLGEQQVISLAGFSMHHVLRDITSFKLKDTTQGRPKIIITTTYPDQDHNSIWKLGHPRFSHHNVYWHFKLQCNVDVLEIMHLSLRL